MTPTRDEVRASTAFACNDVSSFIQPHSEAMQRSNPSSADEDGLHLGDSLCPACYGLVGGYIA
jgi:hypothetical protein